MNVYSNPALDMNITDFVRIIDDENRIKFDIVIFFLPALLKRQMSVVCLP